MLACATRWCAWPQHPPLPALSLTALPSLLSCAGACSRLGASAQGSRPAACPQPRHSQCGAGSVGVSILPGSCYAASPLPRVAPATAGVTLRARMHAQALLCGTAVAARRPMQRHGYPASSHARAGCAVLQRGCREPLRQQPGYPASSRARAGSAVRHHGRCEASMQRHGYPASSHARADTAVLHRSCRGPGSGMGTLRALMHAQTLLCCIMVAASHSGSGMGTLRARTHAQTLLCGTMVTASCTNWVHRYCQATERGHGGQPVQRVATHVDS